VKLEFSFFMRKTFLTSTDSSSGDGVVGVCVDRRVPVGAKFLTLK
jgi:hypothetical protein